jgi:hypothetical protein
MTPAQTGQQRDDELNRKRLELAKQRAAGVTTGRITPAQPTAAELNKSRLFELNKEPRPAVSYQSPSMAGYRPKGQTQTVGVDVLTQLEEAAREEALKNIGATGGAGGPSTLDRYTQMLQGMLKRGDYTSGSRGALADYLSGQEQMRQNEYDRMAGRYQTRGADLLRQLGVVSGQAEGTVGSAFDQLQNYLQTNQSNPYAQFQAAGLGEAAPAPTAALADVLATQGVNRSPVDEYANMLTQQNAAQANAFQNIANVLSAGQAQSNVGRLQDVAAQRALTMRDLAGQRAGMQFGVNAQTQDLLDRLMAEDAKTARETAQFGLEQRFNLANQEEAQRQNLLELLMNAVAKGGRTKGRLI